MVKATQKKSNKPSQRKVYTRKDKTHNWFAQNTPLLSLGLLVVIIVLIIYWPSLSAQALSIDDQQYLVSNRLIQNPGLTSAGHFLGEVLKPSTVPGYYQPLGMISLMTDYAMGGRVNNLRIFHLTSLIIHLLNTILIIFVLYLLFKNYWVAALVGLLFGIHPITVETIPWIGERKTLLAAFFVLCSLIFYILYAQKKSATTPKKAKYFYLLSLITYLFALLSKPTSLPLPLIMLLLDFWPLQRLNALARDKQSLMEKIPFLIIGAISAIVTYLSQKYTAGVILPGNYNPVNILLVICYNIFFYFSKIFWPHNMSSYNPFPSALTISNPAILTSVIVTAALITVLLLSLRRTKAFFCGGLIFFIALLPTTGIIGFTNVIVSDKYAYFPFIGILIVLGWLLSKFWDNARIFSQNIFRKFTLRQIIIITAIVFLGVAEGFITHSCLAYWKDSETLTRYMLKSAPKSPILHDHLGYLLLEKKTINDAIAQFEEAIRIEPKFFKSYNNLGIVLVNLGQVDQGISYYQKGIALNPKFSEAYNNLGIALERKGNNDEAIVNYQKAIQLNPNYANAYFNLGKLLYHQGKLDEAVKNFEEALKIEPQDVGSLASLGLAFAQQRKIEQAIEAFRKTEKLAPLDPEVRYNLGLALSIKGDLDEAITCFNEALNLNPNMVDAYNNLGIALAVKGNIDDGIKMLEKSLQIDPKNERTQQYLKSVLEVKNENK